MDYVELDEVERVMDDRFEILFVCLNIIPYTIAQTKKGRRKEKAFFFLAVGFPIIIGF